MAIGRVIGLAIELKKDNIVTDCAEIMEAVEQEKDNN